MLGSLLLGNQTSLTMRDLSDTTETVLPRLARSIDMRDRGTETTFSARNITPYGLLYDAVWLNSMAPIEVDGGSVSNRSEGPYQSQLVC